MMPASFWAKAGFLHDIGAKMRLKTQKPDENVKKIWATIFKDADFS